MGNVSKGEDMCGSAVVVYFRFRRGNRDCFIGVVDAGGGFGEGADACWKRHLVCLETPIRVNGGTEG